MQYTETELAKLIETVESEFTAHLSKAEALAKSEDAPPKKEDKPEDKKPAAEAKPAAEGAKAPEAAPAAPEAKPEAAGAAPAAAPAIPGAAPAADHGYDDEDMQHMDQMYASMSEPELKAHHDSIRKCLDAKGGAAQAGAAPAAPAAAAPAANPMGKSEAGKSEISAENPVLNSKPKAGGTNLDNDPKNGGIEGAQPHDIPNRSEASKDSKNLKDAMAKAEEARRNGGKIEDSAPHNSPGAKSPASKADGNQMEKSEKEFDLLKNELEAEKAKTADLKKNFDAAQEFLTKLVGKISAPKGKAITEVAALQKNEGGNSETPSLSKAEITEKLFQRSSDPKLEKRDRDAINKFYDGGQININSISHLLK